jgi:uncharacterized protein YndB with AHSA1/START domain
MLKLAKGLAVLIGLLLVVGVVGGLLMPGSIEVSREAVINAPPPHVFRHLNDLKAFNKWSPWANAAPDMKVSFSGPNQGVGQVMKWSSSDSSVGTGTQTIVESHQDERVVSDLDFGQMGTAQATFELTPEGDGTKVVWQLYSELGLNPLARWMGPVIKSGVAQKYEEGLVNLKRVAENQ